MIWIWWRWYSVLSIITALITGIIKSNYNTEVLVLATPSFKTGVHNQMYIILPRGQCMGKLNSHSIIIMLKHKVIMVKFRSNCDTSLTMYIYIPICQIIFSILECYKQGTLVFSYCCSDRIIAFQEACRLGRTDIVQRLLAEWDGNDLISEIDEDDGGLNALQVAAKNKRSHVVQILLRRYEAWPIVIIYNAIYM